MAQALLPAASRLFSTPGSALVAALLLCWVDDRFLSFQKHFFQIHMLLAAPPILAPAKLARYIKGRSSRYLQAEFAELRKQYWGQHMWARGYFCATVGAVDEATIKSYIENQRWDEDDEAFKITVPTKPCAGSQPGQTSGGFSRNGDFQSQQDSTGFKPVVVKCFTVTY